jgi:tRNA pseudouridine38-40 synthase
LATYKLVIEYDGSNLHGWQVQPGVPSVQGNIEEALSILFKQRPSVIGAGRTDAGVHARGQVAHFKTDFAVQPRRLRRSLNGILPASIRILDVIRAEDDFHARYSAVRRRYRYYVSTEPRALEAHVRLFVRPVPDFDVMNQAAAHIVGRRDFSSFCRTGSETENRVCDVIGAEWIAESRPGDWFFEIEADRFLHGMVRTIVGTLLLVGHGRTRPDDLPKILDSKDRRSAGPTAPPRGLVLEWVGY